MARLRRSALRDSVWPMKRISRCALCGREFARESGDESQSGVFCSARCRLLDLGNWLGERYVIPGAPAEPSDGAEGPGDGSE